MYNNHIIFRQHDIRIALSCVDVVPLVAGEPLFEIVKQILHTVRYSSQKLSLTFVPRSSSWNIHFIRHKIRAPYLPDDKYIVTKSCIRECNIDLKKHDLDTPLVLKIDDFDEKHYELEVSLYG